jgi:hypothetical protein
MATWSIRHDGRKRCQDSRISVRRIPLYISVRISLYYKQKDFTKIPQIYEILKKIVTAASKLIQYTAFHEIKQVESIIIIIIIIITFMQVIYNYVTATNHVFYGTLSCSCSVVTIYRFVIHITLFPTTNFPHS